MKSWLPLLFLACLAAQPADAREARRITTIARPGTLPSGAVRPTTIRPLSRDVVEQAVRDVATAWNTGQLSQYLSSDMNGGASLQDSLASVVPRDARLTVLAVQNVATLDQYEQAGRRISTVLAVVRTQIEFNDPRVGFRRLEGLNEWYFRVEE